MTSILVSARKKGAGDFIKKPPAPFCFLKLSSFLFTDAPFSSLPITNHSDFSDAMSMEKRYFTSDLANLS